MSTQSHHDRYVKRAMADPAVAVPFFKTNLPPEIAADLDLDDLKQEPTNFVDPKLKETQCDMLFSAPYAQSEKQAFLYILFEHKSSPTKDVLWQMFKRRYLIMDRHMEKHQTQIPPMVLPIILYHGSPAAFGPLDISDIMDVPKSMDAYRIHAPLYLINLSEKQDEDLQHGLFLSLFQTLLKYINDPLLVQMLWSALPTMIELSKEDHGREFVIESLRYILKSDDEPFKKEQVLNVSECVSEEVAVMISAYEQELIDLGKAATADAIARQLLNIDLDVETVAKCTQLPLPHIQKLHDQLPNTKVEPLDLEAVVKDVLNKRWERIRKVKPMVKSPE